MVTTSLHEGNDPLAQHSLSPRELKEVLAAERAGEPFLAFRDGDGRLVLLVLGREGSTGTIGRRTEVDLSIPWDSEVSGLHARLQCLGGEWTIVDDGLSTNGTFVNGQRVQRAPAPARRRPHPRRAHDALLQTSAEVSSADRDGDRGRGTARSAR